MWKILKTFAKLLKPEQGNILLDGKSIFAIPSKQMAQMLGLLPQSPVVPEGIKVTDLVARGRFPYRKLLSRESPDIRSFWSIVLSGNFPHR